MNYNGNNLCFQRIEISFLFDYIKLRMILRNWTYVHTFVFCRIANLVIMYFTTINHVIILVYFHFLFVSLLTFFQLSQYLHLFDFWYVEYMTCSVIFLFSCIRNLVLKKHFSSGPKHEMNIQIYDNSV